MTRSQLGQGPGQVMTVGIMGQVNQADGALVILAQRLAQHTPQRAQAGTGSQQPQRPGLPVGIVLQCAATQFSQAQAITRRQCSRGIAECAGLPAIDMKLQESILLRQAGQGVRPCHLPGPHHQVLPGAIPQPALRVQPQAQHRGTQPIGTHHLGRQTVTQRVERFDLQIADHLALARQAPALLALCRAQGIGLLVLDLTLAPHQARMATAGSAAVRHGHTRLVQGIQQVAAGGYRPMAFADVQFRHGRTQSQGVRTGNHACDSLTIVGCIGHRAGLYCRAFLASRLHHLACLGKVDSADRCTPTEPTFIECSLIEERDS